jgi:hypothetical protein
VGWFCEFAIFLCFSYYIFSCHNLVHLMDIKNLESHAFVVIETGFHPKQPRSPSANTEITGLLTTFPSLFVYLLSVWKVELCLHLLAGWWGMVPLSLLIPLTWYT